MYRVAPIVRLATLLMLSLILEAYPIPAQYPMTV